MEKLCLKCQTSKPVTEFYKDKRVKDGFRGSCKTCIYAQDKAWSKENKNKKAEHSRNYRLKNKERMSGLYKKWRENNKEARSVYSKKRHKEKRGYYQEYRKRYSLENPEKVKLCRRAGMAKIRSTPQGKLNHSMSAGIYASLKNNKGKRRWEVIVGYTINNLQKHLQEKFSSGMSWENYGEWHIDHKIPLCAFNYEKPEDLDFRKAWALENLQPLWKLDNLLKGGSVKAPLQPSLLLAVAW